VWQHEFFLWEEQSRSKRVVVTVKEVKGFCRAEYKVGDKFIVEDSNISLNESTRICASAFSAMYPKIYSLRRGLDPSLLGGPAFSVS
jgi:uncharacterized repeat protein (TIGR04076 family)